MTISHPAPIPETDDALGRLNAVERDLLGLLGRGHTAKSIATLRSLSEAAVNKRFRSARRKTGIGSSREIARLIVAQENRHDFIGLAQLPAEPPELRRSDAPRRASPIRWRLPMAAAVILAAAILAQQTSVSPPPSGRAREIAQAVFDAQMPAPNVAGLHALVIAGGSDPVWSPTTETALANVYEQQPAFSDAVESFNITCNASLCEVLAISRSGLSLTETNAFLDAAQGADVHNASVALKMDIEVQHFTSTQETPQKTVMASYWRRRAD